MSPDTPIPPAASSLETPASPDATEKPVQGVSYTAEQARAELEIVIQTALQQTEENLVKIVEDFSSNIRTELKAYVDDSFAALEKKIEAIAPEKIHEALDSVKSVIENVENSGATILKDRLDVLETKLKGLGVRI